MNQDRDSLSRSPMSGRRRLWITLLASAAIIAGASILARTYPNSGFQAGYEATMDRGQTAVQAEIAAANGIALTLCNDLYAESESSPGSPRYDYDSFIKGCGEAVDHAHGRHVPLLTGGR